MVGSNHSFTCEGVPNTFPAGKAGCSLVIMTWGSFQVKDFTIEHELLAVLANHNPS
jgi:hypothetical protein